MEEVSLQDADKDFHLANAHVDKLKDEDIQTSLERTIRNAKASSAGSTKIQQPTDASLKKSAEPIRKRHLRDKKVDGKSNPSDFCSYIIQDLSNLSCYSVRFQFPPSQQAPETNDPLMIQLEHLPAEEATVVSIQLANWQTMRIAFPGHITEASSQPMLNAGSSVATIRLSYRPNSRAPHDDSIMQQRMTPIIAETSACRFCSNSLIMGSKKVKEADLSSTAYPQTRTIHSVAPLPSSRWDDMMDYLTCYPGQATVEFNTAMIEGQVGRILEDTTAIVAHASDLHTSVLHGLHAYGQVVPEDAQSPSNALTGLDGDASFRGVRPWRDSVVGPSVACNYCASVVGSCPAPETMRLLKHRLQVKRFDENTGTTIMTPLLSISAFVGHEMIRYAETKAIFAFRIRQDKPRKTCLVLRIISWDNFVATSDDVSISDGGVHWPQWKRMLQVVYEETMDLETVMNTKNLWMWSTDWCCEPIAEQQGDEKKTSSNTPVSAVNLVIEAEEWNELFNELKCGSAIFPSEVAAATVIAKTGSNKASLSAIFLP
jgi:hypothetical protein